MSETAMPRKRRRWWKFSRSLSCCVQYLVSCLDLACIFSLFLSCISPAAIVNQHMSGDWTLPLPPQSPSDPQTPRNLTRKSEKSNFITSLVWHPSWWNLNFIFHLFAKIHNSKKWNLRWKMDAWTRLCKAELPYEIKYNCRKVGTRYPLYVTYGT